jgi:HEAT repeat protein
MEGILLQLGGAKATDTAILSAMQQATGDTQRSLVAILAKRNVQSAVPALLPLAKGTDIATAKAALQALATLATDDDVPAVLGVLADLKVPELRSDAESTAAKALLALDNASQRTPLVLTALGNPTDIDVRHSQLRLLSACGDAQALTIVTAGLTDKEPRIREAAVRALGDWPELAAWDALTRIYSQPEKDAYHVLALRGLVRLADHANAHPDAAATDRYRQLLIGAKTDSDRKQILGALGHLASPAALELALPMLTVTGIRAEAELAVKTIADAIQHDHPEVARNALQQLKPAKT